MRCFFLACSNGKLITDYATAQEIDGPMRVPGTLLDEYMTIESLGLMLRQV